MTSTMPTESSTAEPAKRQVRKTSSRAGRVLRVSFAVVFPFLVLGVFMLWVDRQHYVEARRCLYGALAAYPPLLWGSIRFMFGRKGKRAGSPGSTIPPFVVGGAILAAAVATTVRAPLNRIPSGWSGKVPRYPGALVAQEACNDHDCAATFEVARTFKEKAKHVDRYDLALLEARLPSQGFPATCPSMGIKCRIYAVADMRLLECFDEAESIVRVRYGSQPCPDGESELDAGSNY